MTNRDLNSKLQLQQRQLNALHCKIKKLELVLNRLIPQLNTINCSSVKKEELELLIDTFLNELRGSKTEL